MESMQRDQAPAREGKLVPLKQSVIIVVYGSTLKNRYIFL